MHDATVTDPSPTWAHHQRTADRVFQGATAVTAALTLVWLYFVVTGRDGGAAFRGYQISIEGVVRVAVGFGFMYVGWGYLWYHIKRILLRRWVGFSAEEARETFTSRMRQPFALQGLLARHSERRIRIADMIGRRGRFVTIALLAFWFLVRKRGAAVPRPSSSSVACRTTSSTAS